MRYKLLIILFLMGCSTDLAPDNLLKYDIAYDELDVAVGFFVSEFYDVLCMVLRFCVNNFILPTVDFTSLALRNVNRYFEHNVYIWLLFYKHSLIHEHTAYGVRFFYSFRRIFFVRGVVTFTCVVTVLLTACILDTSHLVPCGWFNLQIPTSIFSAHLTFDTLCLYIFFILILRLTVCNVVYLLQSSYKLARNFLIVVITRGIM